MTPAGRPTLTRELLLWTLGSLLLVWASFVGVGYLTGQHEADELTDGHLASASALLLAYGGGAFREFPAPPVPGPASELKAHDYQQSLSVVLWDAEGRVLTRSGRAPVPPFARDEGFATLNLGQPTEPWRAFARWDPERQRRIMVLLSVRERDELAEDIAGQVTEPGLWLLPVVALVLGLAVRHGLRPLHDLTRELHALDIHRPQPLGVRPRHAELAGAVDAIHLLVERYHAALSRERALANEFAHELRTPLAALALQARALRHQPQSAGPALDAVEAEALRAGEVLNHLLALARASRAELDEAAQPTDLAELSRQVVAEFAPAAHASGRDLALVAPQPLLVQGHPVLLQMALRNLVENALHHTPAGTQVEVQVDAPGRCWRVIDLPPPAGTIPAEAAASAHPVLGLGLGLRVVEKVATIHGASFSREPRQPAGTSWGLVFPAPPADPGSPPGSA